MVSVGNSILSNINKENQHEKTKKYILQYLVIKGLVSKEDDTYKDILNMDRNGILKY